MFTSAGTASVRRPAGARSCQVNNQRQKSLNNVFSGRVAVDAGVLAVLAVRERQPRRSDFTPCPTSRRPRHSAALTTINPI